MNLIKVIVILLAIYAAALYFVPEEYMPTKSQVTTLVENIQDRLD